RRALFAGVAKDLADHGGDGAARRIAADGEALRIGAERRCIVADVPEGRDTVVGWRREGMLGRQAIVDRDHLAAALVGESPARRVMGLDVADHEAATVIVDQRRQRPRCCALWPIAAKADLSAR